MDEVVEVSVGALHLLARTPENRQTMRQLNTIRLFVQVLKSNESNTEAKGTCTMYMKVKLQRSETYC